MKNLFENTASMYNRITRRIFIEPFHLREIEQMADSLRLGWSRDMLLQYYMVFGGFPYYLDMIDGRKSLAQNIDELCLAPNASLRDEVFHLMEATLGGSALHRDILRALASSKIGVKRVNLAVRLGVENGGSFARALDDLEKCGYIKKYANRYGKRRPMVYQLVDPFLLFAFRFMERSDEKSWASFEGTPAYYAWRENAFEIACLNHIEEIKGQ